MICQDRIDAIHEFWFGDMFLVDLPEQRRHFFWFGGTPEVAEQITTLFKDDLQAAIDGELDAWGEEPSSCLALIILLDQFSRHIYRRTPQAFAQDQKALVFCREGIQLGHDHSLTLIERAFFYMPFEHSPLPEMQEKSVVAYQGLLAMSLSDAAETYYRFLRYAMEHYEMIDRFGRFPNRNGVLGLVSTEEEKKFLNLLSVGH